MKQFSLKALLFVVLISAFLFWWMDDGYREVFSEYSPAHGKLEVFGRHDWSLGHYVVRIRHTPVDGFPKDADLSGVLLFKKLRPGKQLSFFSMVDEESGTWLVCDQNQHGLVILVVANPQNRPANFRQMWHPGVHLGWLRGLWAKRFRALQDRHTSIPYESLPNEVRVVAQE